MSVVNTLDKITIWAQKNICDKIQFKVPPEDNAEAVDGGYEYQLVTPSAFPLFVPAKDKLPPNVISPFPSLCVRILEGSESLQGDGGSMSVQMAFSTWDVGLHGNDIFIRNEDGSYTRYGTTEDGEGFFRRTGGGWRDAWNIVDIALRAIESTVAIDGIEIDRTVPVKYGPLSEQGNIPDFYPFWFAWIEFGVKYPLVRNVDDIEKYL